jgi:molybdopterin molybdotransferase
VGVSAPDTVRIFRPARPGENVRPRGQDVHAGEIVLPSATRLYAQHIGLLAMLGIATVPVHRLARIGLFSSGDELVPVSEPLTPGKIHDSNSYTLNALVERDGAVPVHLGVAPDNATAIKSTLDRAVSEKADLIISSAGVSVGAFDFVRTVIESHGELNFWRVNMRPGKPLAFGNYRGIPFIGLPGNPVSAYVGYEIFVRPALLKMAGIQRWERVWQPATLLEPVESDGRESYLRGVVSRRDGRLVARLTGHQGSGNLRSLVQANALLMVPSEVKSLPAGSEINAWLMDDVMNE